MSIKPKPINNKALNGTNMKAQSNKEKRLPMSNKTSFSIISPSAIDGTCIKIEYSINLYICGLTLQLFLIKSIFNIDVNPKTKVKPTSNEYIPKYLGKNQIDKSINEAEIK